MIPRMPFRQSTLPPRHILSITYFRAGRSGGARIVQTPAKMAAQFPPTLRAPCFATGLSQGFLPRSVSVSGLTHFSWHSSPFRKLRHFKP